MNYHNDSAACLKLTFQALLTNQLMICIKKLFFFPIAQSDLYNRMKNNCLAFLCVSENP